MASTGIFDNDLILPGVITEIIPDYAQDYDTSSFGTTESVTIIGTAFNGPVGRVTPIFSPEHANTYSVIHLTLLQEEKLL